MLIQIPNKLVPVFQGPARYRGAYGGRGSAKSVSFVRMALARGIEKSMRIMCGREFQNSILDSIHAEMCTQIGELGMDDFYHRGETYISGANGTEVFYRGLSRNYQSLKSISNVDLCLLEEAEYVSEKSWRFLDPTIRKPGSEIWPIWNPERTDSETKKRFIDNPDPDAKIVQMNWRDNPWFPETLNKVRLRDFERDPDTYRHVWEGECMTRSDAQVFRGKWVVRNFVPGPDWDGPYNGADWGFAVDPTVLVKCWIYQNCLYIEYEAYGSRTELDDIPELFDKVPDARKYKIYADNSRPETISHVKNRGFDITAADKWPGSVEDGIEYIRGAFDKIVIHTRCVNTAKEAQLYSYKIDRLTSEVLPDVVDKHNHCMDAIRYALAKMIKTTSSLFDF